MSVKDIVAKRFADLCKERSININELATLSGVTPSTAYSMMDKRRQDISIVTIKKFCDGLGITLGEFFSTEDFDNLEQEIKQQLKSYYNYSLLFPSVISAVGRVCIVMLSEWVYFGIRIYKNFFGEKNDDIMLTRKQNHS